MELEKPIALTAITDEDGEPIEVLVLEVTPDEVSSTAIREALTGGDDVGDLVAPSVRAYIHEHGLYA